MATTISNPPYNMKWQHPFFAQSQERFMLGVPPQSNANYAFILTALSKQDKAVFLLPNGVLTTNNKEEQAIKKSLIEKNYLEAVIALPDRMFESTSIPTSLLIFNKEKQTSNILMINADSLVKEEVREQRGQVGSKSHTSRVYKKKINVLPNEAIKKIGSFLDKPEDAQGVSKVVSIETIKEHGYVLTPNRYIEMKQEDIQHSSLEKLSEELNRISSEKGAVKLTINRKMANDLGLLPLIKLLQESTEASKELNDAFKDEGVSLNTDSIVTLTNSKTFKIEVKKWDKLPDLIVMFAQMWKQVMVHYNNEENRYLMELKDIMLDKLFKQI
ncbi:N-6 DNA methylase [Limosilactobacillus sp. BG-MG3-A]|uniref:site-specific DNA-methyltransferase (adenine-specific) n=1 Tax=Limosilactobacillus agrestis TaxID=2759748 RepID=A0A7W3UIH2_9LACO|nr:N-6 DNA methylase [Limosilactobacillus agrestis]MBB1096157.1 N-6 DNA methylase [Limosilactobacillus agrestis]MCD7120350.1 SAM-dependent methyltransferase [Limosilactobacillus agrestis]